MRTALGRIAAAAALALAAAGRGEEWTMPKIALPERSAGPVVAAAPAELARLRAAWRAEGAAHRAVAGAVSRADAAMREPLTFPPRGGQHNQWYQCDACQLALKTVDETHHQCPRCKKVYTGEPYDDVIYSRRHGRNLRGMTDAAWAFALTGRRTYADHAAKVLLGYAERYRNYPYHSAGRSLRGWGSRSGGHLFEQTLNEASCMTRQVAPAYDLVHDALSDAQRARVREGLLLAMLANIDRNKAGKSNWQTWHNAALLWGGAVAGREDYVRRALADPRNGFAQQMRISVTSDGMWYENSWGYHFYTLMAMVEIAEGARRLGIDVWGHPSLRRMFTLPARYTMADGSLPRFGDDVNTSLRGKGWMMEAAWHAGRDAALAPLLPTTPNWWSVMLGRKVGPRAAPVPKRSAVFPGAGHAILHTAGEAHLSAAMTFGPYGGFHGHYDKLSFVLFGRGRELGVDPGRARSQAYRLPIHRDWYKATIGHNTVIVDGASQKPAAGKLELFAANEACAAVAASCTAAYPGVTHRRLLCQTDRYLLVVDDLAAGKPRRFDWLYHNRGSSVRCDAATKPGRLGERYPGQEYVRNVKLGATDGPVGVVFAGKDVATHLLAGAAAGTEVRIGDGVGASVLDRVPMVMITRRGRGARFAVALEPVARGGKPTVRAVALDAAGEAIRVTVRSGETTDVVTLTAANRLTVLRGGKTVLSGAPAGR